MKDSTKLNVIIIFIATVIVALLMFAYKINTLEKDFNLKIEQSAKSEANRIINRLALTDTTYIYCVIDTTYPEVIDTIYISPW